MSRYPSAYGYTPSYRSYTSTTSSGLPSYPSTPSRRVEFDMGSSVSVFLICITNMHFIFKRGRTSSPFRDDLKKEFSSVRMREFNQININIYFLQKSSIFNSDIDLKFLFLLGTDRQLLCYLYYEYFCNAEKRKSKISF